MSVFGGVSLASLFGVMRGEVEMALRYVGMMAGLLMIARLMVFGGGGGGRGVFVVLRSFAVVLRGIFRRHRRFSKGRSSNRRGFGR
jgi:hypothetical protein